MGRRSEQKKLKQQQQQRRRVYMAILLGMVLLTAVVTARLLWRPSDRSAENPPSLPPPTKSAGELPATLGDPWQAIDNPKEDGWETEAFSSEADQVLKKLGKLALEHPDQEHLRSLVTESFSCDPLLPTQRTVVFEDGSTTVERMLEADPAAQTTIETDSEADQHGPQRLAAA